MRVRTIITTARARRVGHPQFHSTEEAVSHFDRIVFDEASHSYTLDGQRLASVTSTIKRLQRPFDADKWAPIKARERGITEEAIRAEWAASAAASVAKGTRVHAHIEAVLRGREQPADADPFVALNTQLAETRAFDDFWAGLRPLVEVNQTEWVIGEPELAIAGTLDALLYSPSTGQFHIWDWKTNKKFATSNRFDKLLSPFSDYPDCELTRYSLQVSLYLLLLRRNTTLPLGPAYILHLAPEGTATVHKALDLSDRLEGWLLSGGHNGG